MAQRVVAETEPAFVLHARSWQETSQILEVFSQSHGRLGIVARGSLRPKSRLRGLLQPFQPLRLSWRGRDTGLLTLTDAESAAPALVARDLALFAGFYVNELLMRLVGRADPHPDLFAFYTASLEALTAANDQPAVEAALRGFELTLLDELGYGINLRRDALAQADIQAGRVYRYRSDLGLLPVGTEQRDERAYPAEHLLAMADRDFGSAEVRRTARDLLRGVLNEHLGGRELKTRKVLSAMLR